MWTLFLYTILFLIGGLHTQDADSIQKKTIFHSLGELGKIRGLIENSARTQREYLTFRDIRYAEAPSGHRRFRPTPIITKFTPELYDATEYRQSCPNISIQVQDHHIDENTLDCLYLTVHTPNITCNLPVLIQLTGFDLLHGSNREANANYIMEQDIVFVSIQYRLGLFGFLNTNSPSIPGNAAILDILTALKWIQKYVSLFGGDPKSVTLFGQHKVAGVIHLLTMIQEADGLFHKIICQSGSVFTENLLSLTTSTISTQIGITLGCVNIFNPKKLSDCILQADLNNLVQVFRDYVSHNGNVGLVTIGGFSRLLPYMPYELKRRNRIRSHPMIIGIVENPSTYLLDENFHDQLSIFSTNRTNLIDGLGLSSEEYKEFLLKRIADEDKKMRKNLKSGIDLSENSERYVYMFRYRGEEHYFRRKPGNPLDDVALLDDNLYLFPNLKSRTIEDVRITEQMIAIFSSFARNSVPNCEGLDGWPAYMRETPRYLIIDKNLSIASNFYTYIEPSFNKV